MVGGLVENEHVRHGEQGARQVEPPTLTDGELVERAFEVLLGEQAEEGDRHDAHRVEQALVEQAQRLVRIGLEPGGCAPRLLTCDAPGGGDLTRRATTLLGDDTDPDVRSRRPRTPVERQRAREDTQQRRLPRPVGTGDQQPSRGRDAQSRAGQVEATADRGAAELDHTLVGIPARAHRREVGKHERARRRRYLDGLGLEPGDQPVGRLDVRAGPGRAPVRLAALRRAPLVRESLVRGVETLREQHATLRLGPESRPPAPQRLILREAVGEVARLAVERRSPVHRRVEVEHPGDDVVEQLSVVGHDDDSTAPSQELGREEVDPGVVEVVRGLVQGEDVRARVLHAEPLDDAAAKTQKGLRIFVRDTKPLESIAKRLQMPEAGPQVGAARGPQTKPTPAAGADGDVSLVMMLDLETEVEMKLPGRFKVSPQIAGAIKAVSGVVDVQTL
ncbi:hypothetical protein GALL_490800 [mine drainage metagenome]|uniref:Uncharacterized protein n=1 Tax=mine drainage metagenome TaxID=410659 RepID=A0A1J5PCH2_9ZZZZ